MSTSRGHAGRTSQPGAGELASAAETLAGLTAAALGGGLDGTAALTSLTAARLLAAELERSELAFIEAARDGGATWSQIAAAMGTRNRQSAQKRHADLTRRRPRPPIADTRPRAPEKDEAPAETWPLPPAEATASREDDRRTLATPAAPGAADGSGRRQVTPKITPQIIVEGRYKIVKAPDHAETRAWHVLVGGKRAGMVRPTWRGERSRPGWEGTDNAGTAIPATGIGRVTTAGNARTRDAAAVSLLRTLLRQQENEHVSAAQ
jgi:hypothetical protein